MTGPLAGRVLPLVAAALLGVVSLAGTASAAEPVADEPLADEHAVDTAVAQEAGLLPGTPCRLGVRACVSLGDQKAWLSDGTKVTHGPVDIISGGPGQETPSGDFAVQWKNKDHKSSEHQTPEGLPSPMPFAVFFAPGGIAFHQGEMSRASAGCVRLGQADAELYYNTLKTGDKVQVVGG